METKNIAEISGNRKKKPLNCLVIYESSLRTSFQKILIEKKD